MRHQPNEGRKVHSYCINSSLSFLSRAHLNQQKAPVAGAGWCPLGQALPPFPLRSSLIYAELNPPLTSPQKAVLLFSRNSWARAIREGVVHATNGPKRVPFVPYGGLATNDSCYSFATQFSLRSTIPLTHLPPLCAPVSQSSVLLLRLPRFIWFRWFPALHYKFSN